MPQYRLLTPGPTQVPSAALLAMARPIGHHRTPEFRAVLAEVFENLKYVFQTKNDVAILTSSGTGAMEAAVANLMPRGGKAIVLESGKFAERWSHLCRAFGATVVPYSVPWGEAFEPAVVADLLAKHPDAIAVFATLQETSTGVGHDIQGIGRVVAPTKALLVVDGISGVGPVECRTDDWGIDVLVVGSQKGLMTPPGLAFVSVSEAAWSHIGSIERTCFYFDLLKYRKGLATCDTPFSPAIPLIMALAESLRILRHDGMEAVWARFDRISRAVLAGIQAIGLSSYAKRPGAGMTAVQMQPGVDAGPVAAALQSRFGIKVAGGQGQAKGKILRIAHLGIIDEAEILAVLAALELVLAAQGQPVKLGASVAAASQVLAAA